MNGARWERYCAASTDTFPSGEHPPRTTLAVPGNRLAHRDPTSATLRFVSVVRMSSAGVQVLGMMRIQAANAAALSAASDRASSTRSATRGSGTR
jgi:hypothetical protein